jgi:arylsulfatase A-like enzyme
LRCTAGGIPTPRIDQFANEGIRFNNYAVEAGGKPVLSDTGGDR